MIKHSSKKKEKPCDSSSNSVSRVSASKEIDQIFNVIDKKRNSKSDNIAKKVSRKRLIQKSNDISKKSKVNMQSSFSNKIAPIRYTEDGLPIYRLEDLNLGKLEREVLEI